MTETKEQILARMDETMPFSYSEKIRPYILEAMQIHADQQLILHGVSNCTDWMVTYRDMDGEFYKIVITAKDEDGVILKFIEDYEGLEWNTIKKIV